MNKFREFNLSEDLQRTIEGLGFDTPTQIQEKAIPLIMEGKDTVGESETGSGKTLAFGAGVIENTEKNKGIQSLIITPTRELAEQVKDELKLFAKGKGLKLTSIYGGVSINPQIEALRKTEVVIATPGRLLDHIERRTIDTSKIKIIVLDEADRMLDMGFIEDIEKILKRCPKQRQMLLFSATMPPQIERLAKRYMKNPVKVSANKFVDPSKLKQVYYDVPRKLKFSLLLHLINKENAGLVMVFCNTRNSTDMVVRNLSSHKIDAIAIHGGFTQQKRTKAIDDFKKGKTAVLVCTDVAARGIHIENISHVYNYDIPSNAQDYVHRIGRTARAGEEGLVINLLCEQDHDNYANIRREYREFNIEKMERPFIENVPVKTIQNKSRVFKGRGKKPFMKKHRKKPFRR